MKKTIAIVTGATGGIGREFTRRLLDDPKLDEIWAVARNEAKLNALKAEFGKKIRIVAADIGSKSGLATLEELLQNNSVIISYLINNAGMAKMGRSDTFSAEEISATIDVNCKAAVIITNMCIPYMKAGSHILNVSSASSFQPTPYINLYAATKVFLRHYSRALNMELDGTGIKVTAVCPGWVDTDMLPREKNGEKIHYPGITTAKKVVAKALKDSRKGRALSICTAYAKFLHVYGKLMPQKMVMKQWLKGIRDLI